MSEIDDIFSSKGKSLATQPVASTSSLPEKKEKKKKNKKRKRDEPTPEQPPQRKPIPETVVDNSSNIIAHKRPKIESKPKLKNTSSATEDFSDSRGSRSRKMTEEGWTIYKEDELGIRDDGGGKHNVYLFFSHLRSGLRHSVMSLRLRLL
ncbi:hypothetical protein C0991_000065 [Blastosporella zonata]|nr:hypothetical protein C0991_000065 [Blastosporella zonata]